MTVRKLLIMLTFLCILPTHFNVRAENNEDQEVTITQLTSKVRSKIPRKATNVPFLILNITAPEEKDIELIGLTIHHSGLGSRDDIKRVKIFKGFKSYGTRKRFDRETESAHLDLRREPISIAAGESVTIVIAADINAPAGTREHIFSLDSSEDIEFQISGEEDSLEIAADFPIQSKRMKIR
jgi:hypothetical protein